MSAVHRIGQADPLDRPATARDVRDLANDIASRLTYASRLAPPPHDLEAERILVVALAEKQALPAQLDQIRADLFFSPEYSGCVEAIRSGDAPPVVDDIVSAMLPITPTVLGARLQYTIERVRRLARARRALGSCERAAAILRSGEYSRAELRVLLRDVWRDA